MSVGKALSDTRPMELKKVAKELNSRVEVFIPFINPSVFRFKRIAA